MAIAVGESKGYTIATELNMAIPRATQCHEVLDDLVLHATTGGRGAADAAGYKDLVQKAKVVLAALEDAELECGTPEQRELAFLAIASEAAKAALAPKMVGKADAEIAEAANAAMDAEFAAFMALDIHG